MPYTDPNNYVHVSGRLAEELADERAERRDLGQPVRQRRQPRRATTGPPARRSGDQTDGKVDGFVCAVGTGGTLAGVAHGAARSATRTSKIALADPIGAAIYRYFTHRRAEVRGHARSPRASARAASPRTSRASPVDVAYQHPRRARRCRSSSTCSKTRACASAARPASTSPARSAWRKRARARPHHRHHPRRLRHPLSEQAVQPGVPARRRVCRCPAWLSADARPGPEAMRLPTRSEPLVTTDVARRAPGRARREGGRRHLVSCRR